MYLNEVFKGRYTSQPPVTEFPNAERLNELMIVGPITVRSACSHHFCMHWRGVKDVDSKMINSVMRGVFLTNPDLRREFLSLLPNKKA